MEKILLRKWPLPLTKRSVKFFQFAQQPNLFITKKISKKNDKFFKSILNLISTRSVEGFQDERSIAFIFFFELCFEFFHLVWKKKTFGPEGIKERVFLFPSCEGNVEEVFAADKTLSREDVYLLKLFHFLPLFFCQEKSYLEEKVFSFTHHQSFFLQKLQMKEKFSTSQP